ncbi:MAG: protein-tyrosine kinase [Oscillospiraceae bacterium]|nr:protein-tyrosine kinase [Oscillospiraceae bacterium]
MNENVKKAKGLEVNVGELLIVLLSKWWIILLSGLVAASVFFAGTKLLITPEYKSTTKIFVLSQQDGNYLTSTDIQLSNYLTKDYAELIKSRTVALEVIDRLDLSMSPESLMSQVYVQTKSDTRIVAIIVENENPELARELANVIREVSATQIMNVMGVQAVNMVDEANLPVAPSSPNIRNNVLLGAAWGCLLAIAFILLRYLLNDTIKNEEDVEKYLNLNVLAAIPTIEPTTTKKGGKFACQTSK